MLLPFIRLLSTPPNVSGLKLCWKASKTLPRPRARLLRAIIKSIMATSSKMIVVSTVIITPTIFGSGSWSMGFGEITAKNLCEKSKKKKKNNLNYVAFFLAFPHRLQLHLHG